MWMRPRAATEARFITGQIETKSGYLMEGEVAFHHFCMPGRTNGIDLARGDSVKKLKFVGTFLLAMGILLYASEAVAGTQRAMRLWVSSVAPALFPFLVLMPMLTGAEACAAYDMLLSKVMQPLFRLPGQAAPAMVIGMIAGSPGGAMAVGSVAGQSGMQKGQAWRIALSTAGVSPAFLIAGVGKSMYGSSAIGAELAAAQLVTQIMLLLLLRPFFAEETQPVLQWAQGKVKNPVRDAVEQVLVICGYMVFFSAVGAVLSAMMGARVGRAILLLVDLPSGLAELAGHNFRAANFVLGMAIGFGGLCIGMQNTDALRKIGMSADIYFAARMISSAIMGMICMLILPEAGVSTGEHLQNPMSGYVFSIFMAAFLMIPVLINLSDKYYLNKTKIGKIHTENG